MEPRAETLAAHLTWLRRVARRIARSSAAADDLVQDTCVTALENAPADAELRPWLRSVMRNLAVGKWRSETRRAQREEIFHQHMPANSEPDPLLEYGVDCRRLAEALETLPEPFRSTVVQRYIEGRSCADIAREEKVPAGTVRWRQTRALELLRGELAVQAPSLRGRRARIVWLLPIVGIERVAAIVSRGLLALSGHSKLAGLVLVGLAVALGIGLLDSSGQDLPASPVAAPSAATVRQGSGAARPWSQTPSAERMRVEQALAAMRARSLTGPASYSSSERPPGDAEDAEQTGQPRGIGIDGDSHPAADLLEDCWRDEHGEPHCREPLMKSNPPGRPTCDFLNRNVAFIDNNRSNQLMNVPYANRFLTAALLANMAMATSMGCQAQLDSRDEPGSVGDNDPLGDGNSSCVTKVGLNDGACTSCSDADGVERTMCAPADCYTETLPDGTVCTTCADEAGNSDTYCQEPSDEEPDEPGPECYTYVDSWRFLCEYCAGQERATCVPAQCSIDAAGCATCVDASGRAITECSEVDCAVHHASATGASSFSVCNISMCPDGTATQTCHYPGTDTCDSYTQDGSSCLKCAYPDGSEANKCQLDPSNPLPDPQFDRPTDLPAPGTCVTEASPGGFWSCTTCTDADGYTNSSCDYGAGSSCTRGMRGGQLCTNCTYPDGSVASLCHGDVN
jgi:RNA polymerase sigma-70 factor (ECF subfamily)